MRIQESEIRLSSRHERDYHHEIETRGEQSFRTALVKASETGGKEAESEQERVNRMLQSLVDAILAALDGKKCRSQFAAGGCLPEVEGPPGGGLHLSSYREWKEKTDIQEHGRWTTSSMLQNGKAADVRADTGGNKHAEERADRSNVQLFEEPPGFQREIEWRWEATEKIKEHERTQVEGNGVIKTADGKSIDFSLNLDMCRDFSCERKYVETGKMVLHDPLVINFEGKAADLTKDRFDFDLDSDGKMERIPGLGTGSGFLVLDRNGNGKVDDGKELFGARTGNGFSELAELDSDHNGWLDEADPGFAKLSVWQGGKDLAGLASKGVGALWLGSTESPFAIKDDANRLLGEIRATGIYLREDGGVGNLQQVDLALEAKKTEAA